LHRPQKKWRRIVQSKERGELFAHAQNAYKNHEESQKVKTGGWSLESETPLNELRKITANDKICVCFKASIIT
jgi:hypothetical protein